MELDGESVLSSEEEEGLVVFNLTPSLKVRPFPGRELLIGGAVGAPVTGDQAFDLRAVVSVFYHFD